MQCTNPGCLSTGDIAPRILPPAVSFHCIDIAITQIHQRLCEGNRRLAHSYFMPRPRLQREPCDCLDCKGDGPPPATAAAAAAARQDPPPKSLVLCLTGVLQPGTSLQEAELPHLDAAVRDGWAGLLACRIGSPPLPQQLLGLLVPGAPPPLGRLPDRFKQLRAVLLTDSSELAQAGALAGCYAVQRLGSSSGGWEAAAQLATRICKLLQVRPWARAGITVPAAAAVAPALAAVLAAAGQPGNASVAEHEEGDDVIDQLLVMLDASCAAGGIEGGAGSNGVIGDCRGSSINGALGGTNGRSSRSTFSSMAALEWADELLNQLNRQPGFRDTVLLTLVVGPGQQPLSQLPLLQQEQALLAHAPGQRHAPDAAARGRQVRRPLQSYQFSGLERVEVDPFRPAIVVHRLAGVIRVDTASALDLAVIQAHGAAGCILAERLLPEVAYKLGRAPKYGA